MSIRRQPPPPKTWITEAIGEWRKWFERVTRNLLVTGRVDVTLDPSTVSSSSTSEQTFTIDGAALGDGVLVTKPSHTTGLIVGSARVTAADTVAIQFANVTGSDIDPPSEQYRIYLFRWNVT